MLMAGIFILIKPAVIFDFLLGNIARTEIYIIAVVVRLAIGIILIVQSGHSKYPFGVEVLGWLFIIAAVCLAAIGRNRFIKLVSWALNTLKPFARLGGLVAILFGGFIIHAFM